MNTSLIGLPRARQFALGALAFGVLFTASIAVADIISGLATTGLSNNVTITNLAIDKPADVAIGDVMIASIAIHDGTAVSVTPPAGWTLIQRTDNDTNIGIASYWKAAGASEPANYTWSLSPQTRAAGGITRYSGVDNTNPIDASAGNIGRGTVATTSSITTSADNAEVIAVYALHVGGNNHSGAFFSTPVGMTEKFDVSKTAAGPTIASSDIVQATAGVAGSKSSTIAGNQQRDWASQQIALKRTIVFSEDFNSYPEATLTGQNGGFGWDGAWSTPSNGNVNNYLVQGTVTYEGSRAIVSSNYNGNISRLITSPATAGTFRVAMRRSTSSAGLQRTLLEGGTTQYAVEFASTGNIVLKSTGGDINLQSYTSDTWYVIEMQYDTTVPQYRARVDGGSWSAWKAPFEGTGTDAVEKIYLDEFDPSSVATNYWDTISGE